MKKWLGYAALIFAIVSLAGNTATAQKKDGTKDGSMDCNDGRWNSRLQNHCEIQEQTVPAGGAVTVDAGRNGGVSVKGWDRGEVFVRTRINTVAPSQAEADQLAKEIRIDTGGLKIHAEGPEQQHDFNWSVSFEVFVPRRTDLSLDAHNGGISIADVAGKIEFEAQNGGVVLRRVGGNVHGETTNGGIVVELNGDRWDGDTLDVKTTNGGVVMSVPENYSAHLETSTVNGNVSVDFPVTVQGRITKELSVNLGAGGPTVRATTTNGGVKLRRLSANE
jgi:DUF4097 and DUF4098 domain-containing protein YvlB